MNFNKLDLKIKEQVHRELTDFASNLGGVNFLLKFVEDIKEEKTHPLLNKSSTYHFSKGKVLWNKLIYKDTLSLLSNTIKEEEKEDYFLNDFTKKKQKEIINMKKALKPVNIRIIPKDKKDGEGFSISIIDSKNEENIKISFMFKILFFYNVSFIKQAINYRIER